jgi:hypothetical protein
MDQEACPMAPPKVEGGGMSMWEEVNDNWTVSTHGYLLLSYHCASVLSSDSYRSMARARDGLESIFCRKCQEILQASGPIVYLPT